VSSIFPLNNGFRVERDCNKISTGGSPCRHALVVSCFIVIYMWCFIFFQTCLLSGKVNMVVPKTSESADNVWMGLAKYVWTGWVGLKKMHILIN
jgi:hypothetical protein